MKPQTHTQNIARSPPTSHNLFSPSNRQNKMDPSAFEMIAIYDNMVRVAIAKRKAANIFEAEFSHSAHAMEENIVDAPVVEASAPVVDESAPVVEASTPVVEESAPVEADIGDAPGGTFFSVFNTFNISNTSGENENNKVCKPKAFKRKVMDSTGDQFPTKLSQKRESKRSNSVVSGRSVKRRKVVPMSVIDMGSTKNPMPSSRVGRVMQIVHIAAVNGGVDDCFDKYPESVALLRKKVKMDAEECGLQDPVDGVSLLRITFKNALCGTGKDENDLMVPFIKYILQDDYTSPECMAVDMVHTCLQGICKQNDKMAREYPRFSFRKLGGTKVSNVAFDIKNC